MAYKLIKKEYCKQLSDYVESYIADAESDIESLPDACVGSSTLVIESGNVYVVNTSGKWALVGG